MNFMKTFKSSKRNKYLKTNKSRKNRKNINNKNKSKKNKNKKNVWSLKGGSIIFKDGKMIKTNETTLNGKPFFRKVFYYSKPPKENEIIAANNEYAIVQILIKNPFPNIVTFYDINKDKQTIKKIVYKYLEITNILNEILNNYKIIEWYNKDHYLIPIKDLLKIDENRKSKSI